MNKYEKLSQKVLEVSGWSEEKLAQQIRLAQQWHNPLNYDNGDSIAESNGWEYLFTEALRREGMGNRYYFRFHDYDMTNVDEVFDAFKNCKNWKRYSEAWKKHAPRGIHSKAVYMLAIVEMSVRGFKHEASVAERYREQGRDVRESTPEEDLKGIDLWVDGKPVQVKSPRTAAKMKSLV